MKIFYFVHITGTDTGISGIPRVVRNLAREFVRRPDLEFVPVSWRHDLGAIVHAEQKLIDNLSRYGGPDLAASANARQPVEAAPGDWLLVAEVPHLKSHFRAHAPVHLDEAIGCAARLGLKVALVFHDILPMIFGIGGEQGRPFVEMSPSRLRARGDDAERLAFARYAHATTLADLVLPVSRTAGDTLRDWLVRHGHRVQRLPPIVPALLPEEVFGVRRGAPLAQSMASDEPVVFVALGLVNPQKNQLTLMAAFLDLVDRRPDLDLRLSLVGAVDPEVAVAASLMARRSKGRIVLHGRWSDGQVRELVARARATIFLSLAEGYGLPVAESLWRGKPCLCSNSGSIAEIAQGGGCLTVDPRSLDAIATGLETLATDDDRYERLLRELAARPFKTWSLYAGQIVDALSAVASGRNPNIDEASALASAAAGRDASTDDGGELQRDHQAALLFSAVDWLIPDAFSASNRPRSLFYAGAINYDRARDGVVRQDILFFGPYVPLPAGRYAFAFDGEIDGELKLIFTAFNGKQQIAETTVASFAKPIVFELPRAVERFEIVGVRTPELRSLTLRSAVGELSASGEVANIAALFAQQEQGGDDSAGGVFDEDGAPLRLPAILPGAKLRVHEAFDAGGGNRLRSGAAIAFERAKHGDVEETTLFFGPYLHLEPGRYSFRLHGELDGPLNLRLTSDFANNCLYETVLTNFDAPIVVDLKEPADKVEAIGARTDQTRALRLNAIEISIASFVPWEEPRQAEKPQQKVRRSLLARALGRS